MNGDVTIKNISYKPEGAYVGDAIPYYENGEYFVYYLHDPRCHGEGIYAEDTTWYMVRTRDGLSYSDDRIILPLGDEGSQNKNSYTGSVIKGNDGLYYAFFTGFNDEIRIDGKAIQSVMMARGSAPDSLEVVKDFRFIADNDIYEVYDWRDPYVFYNEEEGLYWMLLCAREKGSGYHRGGCIALCKSPDLISWSYERPFYTPNMYITMECPEVFRMEGRWYLVFSTFSDRFMTHYRVSDSLQGPWRIVGEDTLDCRCDYAIKTAGTESSRLAFGWISTKKGGNDFGPWEWGGTLVAHSITADKATGRLLVHPVDALTDLYSDRIEPGKELLVNASCKDGGLSSDGMGALLFDGVRCDDFALSARIRSDAAEFGFFIGTDEKLENGYQIRFLNGLVAIDRWPRIPKGGEGIYQWQIKGDVPFAAECLRFIGSGDGLWDVRIFRCGEILFIYVNDEVVLSTRAYDFQEGLMGAYVVSGKIDIERFDCLAQKR